MPDDALATRLAELAHQYQMPVERFRAELEKRNSLDNVVEEIRINRALDRVLELAQVTQA